MIVRYVRLLILGSLIAGLTLLAGCSARVSPPPVRTPPGEFSPKGFEQQGVASWYGPKFHGRKTANGEVYNMYDMTAAHRYIPFGTELTVRNLNNDRQVIVRINDRGPFIKNRIIDLSYTAAKKLDMVGTGTAPVRLTVHKAAPSARASRGTFYIQTGSFRELDNAESMHSRLVNQGYTGTRLLEIELDGQRYWRVQAGTFKTLQSARQALEALRADIPASFIVAD